MKKVFSKLVYWYSRLNSDRYLDFLRSKGCRIGTGTKLFCSPRCAFIDSTHPELIEIGNNVQITRDVHILTHGYDWAVLKGVYGDVLGSAGKVTIGNNCFIGMNAIILKGTTIGNNCIVGAGSLVSGTYPDNVVIAGNPGRILYTLEEYHQKRVSSQLEEAKTIALEYRQVFNRLPTKDVFSEFFWLFEQRDKEIEPKFREKMLLVNNYEMSLRKYNSTPPRFDSFEDFLDYCYSTGQYEAKNY